MKQTAGVMAFQIGSACMEGIRHGQAFQWREPAESL